MRWCWMIAAIVAAAVASHEAIAAEQPGPRRPDRPGMGPMVMFERLDRNKDGLIEASEVPEGAPEPIKQFLKRADRDGDRKISKDEFAEAMKAGPPLFAPERPSDRDARGRGEGPPARDTARGPDVDRRGDRGSSDRPPARPDARDRGPQRGPVGPAFGPGRGPMGRGPAAPYQWQGRGPQRGPVAPHWAARGPQRGPVGPAFGPGRGPWSLTGPALPPQAKKPPVRGGKPSPVAHDGEVKQLQQKVKQLHQELKVLEAKLAKQAPPKEKQAPPKEKPEKLAPKAKPPHDGGEKPAKPEKHEHK